MSKASIQSIVILSVVAGSLYVVEDQELLDEEMPTVLYVENVASDTLNQWPESGNKKVNLFQAFRHCENFKSEIESAGDLYTGICLISLSQMLLSDLYEKVGNRKKEMLGDLMAGVDALHDMLDPDGEKFEAYAQAEQLAKIVKDEINFV